MCLFSDENYLVMSMVKVLACVICLCLSGKKQYILSISETEMSTAGCSTLGYVYNGSSTITQTDPGVVFS